MLAKKPPPVTSPVGKGQALMRCLHRWCALRSHRRFHRLSSREGTDAVPFTDASQEATAGPTAPVGKAEGTDAVPFTDASQEATASHIADEDAAAAVSPERVFERSKSFAVAAGPIPFGDDGDDFDGFLSPSPQPAPPQPTPPQPAPPSSPAVGPTKPQYAQAAGNLFGDDEADDDALFFTGVGASPCPPPKQAAWSMSSAPAFAATPPGDDVVFFSELGQTPQQPGSLAAALVGSLGTGPAPLPVGTPGESGTLGGTWAQSAFPSATPFPSDDDASFFDNLGSEPATSGTSVQPNTAAHQEPMQPAPPSAGVAYSVQPMQPAPPSAGAAYPVQPMQPAPPSAGASYPVQSMQPAPPSAGAAYPVQPMQPAPPSAGATYPTQPLQRSGSTSAAYPVQPMQPSATYGTSLYESQRGQQASYSGAGPPMPGTAGPPPPSSNSFMPAPWSNSHARPTMFVPSPEKTAPAAEAPSSVGAAYTTRQPPLQPAAAYRPQQQQQQPAVAFSAPQNSAAYSVPPPTSHKLAAAPPAPVAQPAGFTPSTYFVPQPAPGHSSSEAQPPPPQPATFQPETTRGTGMFAPTAAAGAEAMGGAHTPHGRPACMLASFGFGGLLVTMQPRNGHMGASSFVAGPVQLQSVRAHLTEGTEEGLQHAPTEQPLGDLKEATLIKYTEERADKCSLEELSSNEPEALQLLWGTLALLIQNKGKLQDATAVRSEVWRMPAGDSFVDSHCVSGFADGEN
ncbi:hypothetical protein CYMTET_26692 [Cymbomonas tetramitiformis]|uniref:Sec16 central conserved domain-containing protein n=1 Tax=Cymbomonas tetramitiformis TaxID=36881 RepID=A0AAE0FRV4_9CHLO|nr:hypothetical protein CYMTET_26692 [Cymbomonas tetramitiformis]